MNMATHPDTWGLTFDLDQARAAWDDWGFNCGPGALAAITGSTLEQVREAIEGFEHKKYTSPTMMKNGIDNLGWKVAIDERDGSPESLAKAPVHGLVRIQWTGPWTEPGMNPRWAYRQTHWIATRKVGDVEPELWVFDINGGLMDPLEWRKDVVPLLIPDRGDGKWFGTHFWQLVH